MAEEYVATLLKRKKDRRGHVEFYIKVPKWIVEKLGLSEKSKVRVRIEPA